MYANGAPYAGDTGGASRFFQRFTPSLDGEPGFIYQPKSSRRERNAGLEGMPEQETRGNYGNGIQDNRPHTREGYEYRSVTQNGHPTVKPLALMRYLVKLICPPGGAVLDPFCGSGSTGAACALEGFAFIGIEQSPEYAEIARRRIAHWAKERPESEAKAVPPVKAPDIGKAEVSTLF